MQLIIAGDEGQAHVCAEIKGLERGEWKYVTSEEHLRGIDLRGKTVLLFGTYRRRYMLVWREWARIIEQRGGRTEEVLDGRLTRDPRRG
ncbi:MAG: hypothetical protein ACREO4_09380 [Lysobacter sp.]